MTTAARGLLVLLLLLLGLAAPATAAAGADEDGPFVPAPRTAWFGPELDWPNDTPAAYDERLGADASLFATSIIYPLTEESEDLLRDLSAKSAQAHAVGVLTIEPSDMATLTDEDAAELAGVIASVAEQDDSYFLVRFAPEMNGSWKPWGRRPITYIKAFQALADAVHGVTDEAAMVWSPTYGAGYPYTRPINSREVGDTIRAARFDRRNVPYLDTDGDGEVTVADDPYAPYYPGDEYVDWVGLTILRFGLRPGRDTNTRPKPGELEERLAEQYGYGDDQQRESFYDRYARRPHQPLLLETAAVYNPARGGPSEADVKEAWLRQVVDAVAARPLLRGAQWLEQTRIEDEVGGPARWQIASDPTLASISRAVLEQGPIALAPVPGIGEDPAPAASPEPAGGPAAAAPAGAAGQGGGVPAFLAGALVTAAVALIAGAVALRIRRRRMIPPWLR